MHTSYICACFTSLPMMWSRLGNITVRIWTHKEGHQQTTVLLKNLSAVCVWLGLQQISLKALDIADSSALVSFFVFKSLLFSTCSRSVGGGASGAFAKIGHFQLPNNSATQDQE